MPNIFLSYRRSDSQDVIGRIYDRLSVHFSKDRVFRDIDSIPLGADFRLIVEQAVEQADVVLVLIGPTWLTTTDARGQRRLDDPNDLVRIEVETALRTGKPIIPLTVAQAAMCSVSDLPESLRPLVFRNGMTVRPDPDFHRDLSQLIAVLEGLSGHRPPAVEPPPSDAFAPDEDVHLWLVMIPAGDEGFRLVGGTDARLHLGKHRDCEVVLHGSSISLRHAVFEREVEGFRCTDSDSVCGTYVNGERVRSTIIRTGDAVRFGDVRCLAIVGPSQPDFGLPPPEAAKALFHRANQSNRFGATDVVDARVYAAAVALYDDYEYRVASSKFALAVRLARAAGLTDHDREVLAYAALLGWLGISQAPLSDRLSAGARLQPEQIATIRKNTLDLLGSLTARQPFASMLELLQTCFNDPQGGGHLGGLLRIASVASRLIVDRPYHQACTPERALETICSACGGEWAFNAAPADTWVDLLKSVKAARYPELAAGVSWSDIEQTDVNWELE